jgi:chromosome segregation ATPase
MLSRQAEILDATALAIGTYGQASDPRARDAAHLLEKSAKLSVRWRSGFARVLKSRNKARAGREALKRAADELAAQADALRAQLADCQRLAAQACPPGPSELPSLARSHRDVQREQALLDILMEPDD